MMKNKMSKDNFSLMVILLIPVAIAINIVGGQLTSVLKIPVDLDTIGVILVGLLAGPIPAAVTGVLTNLINGIFDPTLIPYAICAFFIGIAAGLLAKYNMTNKVWKLVISGIVIAIVACDGVLLWRIHRRWRVDAGGRSDGDGAEDSAIGVFRVHRYRIHRQDAVHLCRISHHPCNSRSFFGEISLW